MSANGCLQAAGLPPPVGLFALPFELKDKILSCLEVLRFFFRTAMSLALYVTHAAFRVEHDLSHLFI